jgi:DNA-binding CsgD family transcriptional regulator
MEGITCINGISFSPDNRLMYFTDSFSCRIDVFDYDSTDGAIYNRRHFADVPLGRGICDGSTVDADGCFWSANMDGWCVTRYDPRGRIDTVINLPTRRVSSLCFGGPNLDTLFIHPVIFLTGHADLQIAIDVMRKGAADFVTKPFDSLFLLQKVKLGLDKSAILVQEREFRNDFAALLNDLSDREMTVLRHVVAGLHNKEIAELLGNSSRTVEIHRANMFEKMGVKSAIELARLMERHGSAK